MSKRPACVECGSRFGLVCIDRDEALCRRCHADIIAAADRALAMIREARARIRDEVEREPRLRIVRDPE